MAGREIRFGLTFRGRYSSHWTVSAKAGRPEFQIMTSAISGGRFHVSIHDRSYGFHVKAVDGSEQPKHQHAYPKELRPGARRFLEIRMPRVTACRAAPRSPGRIAWLEPPDDPGSWATFHVVVHDRDVDDPSWWLGKTVRSKVGEMLLADGSTLLVLAGAMPGFGGRISGHSTSPHAEELRALARAGDAGAILMGLNGDDSLWILDLPAPNRVASDGVEDPL